MSNRKASDVTNWEKARELALDGFLTPARLEAAIDAERKAGELDGRIEMLEAAIDAVRQYGKEPLRLIGALTGVLSDLRAEKAKLV